MGWERLTARMEEGSTVKKNPTKSIPNTKPSKYKHTKIYASIGPATNSYEMVLEMIRNGVNAFNMNFSHGDYDERIPQNGVDQKSFS